MTITYVDEAPKKSGITYADDTSAPDQSSVRALPGESAADWYMRTQAGAGARFLPDIAFGATQPISALMQMRARTSGVGIPQVEQVNQAIKDAYEKYFPSNDGDVFPAIRRGVGQSLVTAPFTPGLAAGRGVFGIAKAAGQGTVAGGVAGATTPVYNTPSDQNAPNDALLRVEGVVGLGKAPASDDYWDQWKKQVLGGMTIGGVLGGGLKVAANVLNPVIDPMVRLLQNEKVRTTLGQAAGPGSLAKNIEDRSEGYIPALAARRGEGIQDFNRALYTRAAAQGPFADEGAQVASSAKVGFEGVDKVGDFLSSQYQKGLDASVPVDFSAVRPNLASLSQMLPEKGDVFDKIMEQQVYSKVTPGGTLTPSVAKQADSELGRLARDYRSSSVAADRQLSLALRQAQSELRDAFADANPDTAPIIRAADKGWATLVQMERASSMIGAKDGIFTPTQFMSAVRAGDTSVRKADWRQGLNADIGAAGQKVLENQFRTSGTTERAFLPFIAGEAMGEGGIPWKALTVSALGSAPYLPGVSPMISRLMTQRSPALVSLSDLVNQAGLYSAAPALAAKSGTN